MTLPLTAIIALAFQHWVGDFLCQSDWMALGKSSKIAPLTVHVGIVTTWIFVAALCVGGATPHMLVRFVIFNGVAHWLTDYVTSRMNKRLLAAGQGSHHWFFVGVGFDQFIHTVCLMGSAALWLH